MEISKHHTVCLYANKFTSKNHYKSKFLAIDVHFHGEPVATDTVNSDTHSIDDGYTRSQLFVVTKSLVLDVNGMKTDNNFSITCNKTSMRGE